MNRYAREIRELHEELTATVSESNRDVEIERYGEPLDDGTGTHRQYCRWEPNGAAGAALLTLTIIGPAGVLRYEVVGVSPEDLS